MTDRVKVTATDDFDDPGRQIVEANGRSIGVFKVDGEFYAIENECVHQGGPVCNGQLRPAIEAKYAAPGKHLEEDYSGDLSISCPWHGYPFSLETGDHVGTDEFSLTTFDVVTEDGNVYVEL